MFEYRAIKLIGSFVAALNGADILVFTGGIGENSDPVRKDICDGLSYLGIKIDEKVNKTVHGKEQIISTPDSKIQVIVIPTDEELTIASDNEEIVSK
jgi:acetate kinase